MIDWDALEEAGHNLTMAAPLAIGISTYYCENCGGLLLVRDMEIEIWHVPLTAEDDDIKLCLGTHSRLLHLDKPKSLKDKLEEMRKRDYERLKEI